MSTGKSTKSTGKSTSITWYIELAYGFAVDIGGHFLRFGVLYLIIHRNIIREAGEFSRENIHRLRLIYVTQKHQGRSQPSRHPLRDQALRKTDSQIAYGEVLP